MSKHARQSSFAAFRLLTIIAALGAFLLTAIAAGASAPRFAIVGEFFGFKELKGPFNRNSVAVSPAVTSDLFISEYIEGSSNNKAIEIYNGTGAPVDMNAGFYVLQIFPNGAAAPSESFNLDGTIANGDVYVVSRNDANAAITAQMDVAAPLVINFDGDDAMVLRKGGSSGPIVDVIGQVGNDPGTEWGTGLTSTADNTITRKNTVCAGDTNPSDAFNPPAEWNGFANNTFTELGSHTANCVVVDYTVTTTGNQIVVTDVSGNGDFLQIVQPATPGQIRFDAVNRTFSVNGGPVTSGTSGLLPLAGINHIIVNGQAGNDTISVAASDDQLPSLTINGGTGNDIIDISSPTAFAPNANLNVDLQDDDPTPGTDSVTFGIDGQTVLQGTGSATIRASKNISFGQGGLTVANGDILLEANRQAVPTSGNFVGISLDFGARLTTTGTGNILVSGRGGNDAATGQHFGVRIGGPPIFFSTISSQSGAAGAGTITINGTAGNGTAQNRGVELTDSRSSISSVTGDISITGQGAATTTGTGNHGVNVVNGAKVTSSGAANIIITGTGGAGASDCYGVGFEGNNAAGTTVSAQSGNITITGTATDNDPGETNHDGVRFEDSVGSSAVSITTGTGSLTVTGTAGNSDPTSSGIQFVDDTSMTLGGALNSFIADSMAIGNLAVSLNAGANALTLRQKTNGKNVGLGSGDNADTLGLTDAELDRITAGTLNIGNANSGNMPIISLIDRAQPTILNLASGNTISFGPGSVNSAGGNVTLDPGTNVLAFTSGVDVTTGPSSTLKIANGKALRLNITGTVPDTNYAQLNVAGLVDITGVNLVLDSGYTPVGGDTFTIVENDGTDAIVGTFTGLPQGATIPNFLGSGLNATISYTGGSGNDVVITVSHPPRVQFSATSYIDDESQSAIITITRTVDLSGTTIVTFSTSNGSANGGASCASGVDYINTSVPVTFAPTEATKTVSVPLCSDTFIESTETVNLSLTNPTPPAMLGTPNTAVLNINETASQFRNTGAIQTVFGSPANVYPSTITISGTPAVGTLRVTLYDVTLDSPNAMDVLLVGPDQGGGMRPHILLVADAGGSLPIGVPITLTFEDSAVQVVPCGAALVTGRYEPTTCETGQTAFPQTGTPPPPFPPYNHPGNTIGGTPALQAAFVNSNPNGDWNLYIRDDNNPVFASVITGSIEGGWGMQIISATAANVTLGGKVQTTNGRGIRNVMVTVKAGDLTAPRTVMTGPFGIYRFDYLTAGESYIVTVRSKRFTFREPSRVVVLNDSVADADFIADP